MKTGYGQYCPLALAAEVLCERWTILVISRIIEGCTTFSDIHRGLPRVSPSLLSRRLGELVDTGVIQRRPLKGRRGYSYHLTEAGADLRDLVMGMAIWGQRWARDMKMEDFDPAFLAWSMHLRLNVEAMPPGRTVLEFDFSGAREASRFWLINEDGKVDMCLKHPGFDSDIVVASDLRLFVEAWRGIRDMREEIQRGRIKLDGPRHLKRAFPQWMQLHVLASYSRKRRGREYRLGQHRMRKSAE